MPHGYLPRSASPRKAGVRIFAGVAHRPLPTRTTTGAPAGSVTRSGPRLGAGAASASIGFAHAVTSAHRATGAASTSNGLPSIALHIQTPVFGKPSLGMTVTGNARSVTNDPH